MQLSNQNAIISIMKMNNINSAVKRPVEKRDNFGFVQFISILEINQGKIAVSCFLHDSNLHALRYTFLNINFSILQLLSKPEVYTERNAIVEIMQINVMITFCMH